MRSPRLRGRQATDGVFTFGMAWRNDFAQGQRMARCWRLFADDEVLVARESYPAFGHAPPIIPKPSSCSALMRRSAHGWASLC